MAAPKKRIKLVEMRTMLGVHFREMDRDGTGAVIFEQRRDPDGKIMTQVPRDSKTGEAIPNAMPENVYLAQTHPVEKALPMLLKRLYLQIPKDKFTRHDAVMGVRLFQNIDDSSGSLLELDDDVYSWVMEKLRDKEKLDKEGKYEAPGIGLGIFGTDLYLIERAMENLVDREGEPKKKAKGKAEEAPEAEEAEGEE